MNRHAGMAKLVDALDLGSSALCMGVRVPLPAPNRRNDPNLFPVGNEFGFIVYSSNSRIHV